MSKAWAITVKTGKEMIRDRKGLGITLGLPVVFMAIFGFAFGAADGNTTYDIAVLDQDEPADWGALAWAVRTPNGTAPFDAEAANRIRDAGVNAFGTPARMDTVLLATLENMTYADGQRTFAIKRVASEAEGRALVNDRDAAAMLVIPREFSATASARWAMGQLSAQSNASGAFGIILTSPEPLPNAAARIIGDPSYPAFNIARGILDGAMSGMLDALVPDQGARVSTQMESVVSDDLTPFDFIAPGLMVFAVLNTAPQAAAVLARERERLTLQRLRLTRMRSLDLLVGVSTAQLAVATIGLALMIGAAMVLGFDPAGSLALALLVILVSAVSVLGVGMIIAAFADKQDDAANLGILFAVPASFLSGAFFPIPAVPLFHWGDRIVQIYDILPSTHAVRALREVLTQGRGFESIQWELGALGILTVVYFGIGSWLYARRRLRA